MLKPICFTSFRPSNFNWTRRRHLMPGLDCCRMLQRAFVSKPRDASRQILVGSRLRVSCSTSTEHPDKARGGLPRFHVDEIPKCEGVVAKLDDDEFWHMTKVLRLKVNDRVELFDGKGGIVVGRLVNVNRHNAEVAAIEEPQIMAPAGPNWHVAAAFSTLKGGRGEWLVEKCTELGARTLTPLLTARSSVKSSGRSDRWERIAMAATKQSQRLHSMEIKRPASLQELLPQVAHVDVALVAAAYAPPLYKSLALLPSTPMNGILFIGPEGDFTPEEVELLIQVGTVPVGLGPRRLRVETAAVALLAGVMLMGDVVNPISRHSGTISLAHAE
ncbi:16S rRNA (uracil1498-N3)-methyltransferase [Marchantia polymorpha subsp. ruderalis]|uniref:16S rRNA (uracil(1498)-N(3))-methyltransferase n=1 Tax=Marchantia polymorpha TaxID=3197 RepID=A0A2R6WKD6_MARPO|nr:hypothetical protein MARPO_0081s0053 [Marchantia polymorpha]PTQ34327.1 hypothetical protein MARPO_0081s0053 [Marchantia polymorpha]BBN18788.1 hypothetical protein Mp_8g05520 [Marchantia polymorpha subsp. ruderalis]BBN18789.1 hypothetical protein Mp_8g05520 [Marchantia polymorpha subsp. ruderalis]|eukprot:PTQ34326.1 hypothetical protein MARPO_0081s0053 [Marchantia polymorpha]